MCMCAWALSLVQLFVTPWTVAHQAPVFLGSFSQEYWTGLPFPSPGDLPDQGLNYISCVSCIGKQFLYQLSHCGSQSLKYQIRSDQISRSVVSDSLRPHESQHARPPCPSPTPRVHSDSRPSSQWCHPAISSSVVLFSSCPQSLPASESFPMSQLFTWGGPSTGVSALPSFLPKKSQGWSPLEWTGWISWQSKGLSRVFSNTTVQKHQFFGTQPSS